MFLSSPLSFILLFTKSVHLIGSRAEKGSVLVKCLKNLLRNHKGDEAETLHA